MTKRTRIAAALFAALAASPLGAAVAGDNLAGVSDAEASFISGGIEEFHSGNGDVLFVRDRTSRWYRLQLNQGCLEPAFKARQIEFENSGMSSRVDRFTRVRLLDSGRYWGRNCRIDSIRRSVAPPQVDSKSPITLD